MLKPLVTDEVLEKQPLEVKVALLKAERDALTALLNIDDNQPISWAAKLAMVASLHFKIKGIIFSSKDKND